MIELILTLMLYWTGNLFLPVMEEFPSGSAIQGIELDCSRIQIVSGRNGLPLGKRKVYLREHRLKWSRPHISVVAIDTSKVIQKMRTDAMGVVELPRLEPGVYAVQLSLNSGEAWGTILISDRLSTESCKQVL